MNRSTAHKLITDLDKASKNLKHGWGAKSGVLGFCLEVMMDDNYSRSEAEEFVVEVFEDSIAKWSETVEPGSYNALLQSSDSGAPASPLSFPGNNEAQGDSDLQTAGATASLNTIEP